MSAEKTRRVEWRNVEDFFALVEDGQKADLLDGIIYMASPDTPRNNQIANFVQVLLTNYVSKRGLGQVFASRVAFVLTEFDAPEPDVAFVATDRLGSVDESRVYGGPNVAVEIVSRDSRSRDWVKKRRLYEQAGVAEYWLIEPRKKKAAFLQLSENGYEAIPLDADRFFRSQAVPGFWLDVDWLFQNPLPSEWDCTNEILAGDPRIQE